MEALTKILIGASPEQVGTVRNASGFDSIRLSVLTPPAEALDPPAAHTFHELRRNPLTMNTKITRIGPRTMRPKRRSLFDHDVEAVFRESQSWSDVSDLVDPLLLVDSRRIFLSVLATHADVPQLLARRSDDLHLQRTGRDIYLYSYRRTFGRTRVRDVKGRFLLACLEPTVWALLCIDFPDFFRHGLLPLIDCLYPHVALPFLTQRELQRILRELQQTVQPQALRIVEFSDRRRLGGTARKRFESRREWTDTSIDSAFEQARADNTWFRTVTADLVTEQAGRPRSTGIRLRVSKTGFFDCNGRFGLLHRTVQPILAGIARDRLSFFSGRGRENTPDHILRPLRLHYENGTFKSPTQPARLVELLKRYRDGSCTVLHGNPYIHVMIVDHRDFSSAELWVVSPDDIVIVPQIRASDAALRRIVNHIFENFGEGKILDFS